MKIKAFVKHLRSGTIQDWEVRPGTYNEYYLPALVDQQSEMWIVITDDDGEETKLHLKR